MLDPVSTRQIPLDSIHAIITTERLDRALYLRVRERWFGWLDDTGQPRKPISLSPGERDSLDFIDYQLSAEQKDACKVWADENADNYLHRTDEIVHDGYRLTFTFDEKNKCVVVTLIGRAKTCPNFNKAMTTRHADIATALIMALFKQIMIFGGESWGETSTESLFG